MVKIGVISDTHGLLREEVLKILRDCDCIFHDGADRWMENLHGA